MKNTIRFARRSISRALCVLAIAAAAPAAAIPDVVSWAARVENDAGALDGTMTVTFELFDATTGGTALWTELVSSAVVVNGDLVHELGSVEPLDDSLIDRDNLFLQVTMNGDVLAPRTALRAVPYALRAAESAHAEEAAHAADATTLAGLSAASFQFTAGAAGGLKLTGNAFAINTSGVVTTMIADAAVTTAKIAANAVTSTQLGDNAVAAAKIQTGAVTSDKLGNGAVTAPKVSPSSINSTAIADGAVGSVDIGTDAVTEAKINGIMIEVYARPVGCGGGLQIGSAACVTLACGEDEDFVDVIGFGNVVKAVDVEFFDCNGTCASRTSPTTCAVGNPVGQLLPATF